MSSFIEPLLTVFFLVVVLFGAWYVSRFAAVKMRHLSQSKYMEVIDRIYLGKDRGLYLIRVGDRAYLIGMTANGMEHISEIPLDGLVTTDKDEKINEFGKLFRECRKRFRLFESSGDRYPAE